MGLIRNQIGAQSLRSFSERRPLGGCSQMFAGAAKVFRQNVSYEDMGRLDNQTAATLPSSLVGILPVKGSGILWTLIPSPGVQRPFLF
jgi:hypothetical protein